MGRCGPVPHRRMMCATGPAPDGRARRAAPEEIVIAPLTLMALAVLAYALVSGRLASTIVTAPIFFAGLGLLLGPVLGVVSVPADDEVLVLVLEAALVMVLFADSSSLDIRRWTRERSLSTRLLGVGLPLTMIAGAVVAPPPVPRARDLAGGPHRRDPGTDGRCAGPGGRGQPEGACRGPQRAQRGERAQRRPRAPVRHHLHRRRARRVRDGGRDHRRRDPAPRAGRIHRGRGCVRGRGRLADPDGRGPPPRGQSLDPDRARRARRRDVLRGR